MLIRARDAYLATSPSDVFNAHVGGDDHEHNKLGGCGGGADVRVVQDTLVEVLDAYLAEGARKPLGAELLAKSISIAEQFGCPLSLRCTKYDVRGDRQFREEGKIYLLESSDPNQVTHSCKFRVVLGRFAVMCIRDGGSAPTIL